MTIHLGRPSPDASCNQPEWWRGNPPADNAEAFGRPFLLGVAPGGVYHASRIAEGPVRSYRTLSPFPDGLRDQVVCFLWHFPWGRPRQPLTGTVFPWSPDFP